MTTTVRIPNITKDAWVELSDGLPNVTVDLYIGVLPVPDVLVRVETSAPDDDDFVGFRLSSNRRSFPFAGLGSSDKVYARSTGAATSVIVARG